MPSDVNVTPSPTPEHKRQAHNHSSCEYMGGCQNYGPFLGPYYSTAPIIYLPLVSREWRNGVQL